MTRDELREQHVERRARAIWQHKPNCRGVLFEDHPFRDDCYREARATMEADRAAGLALVPVEATEGMLDNAVNDALLPRILDFTTPEERDKPHVLSKTIWRAAIAEGNILEEKPK